MSSVAEWRVEAETPEGAATEEAQLERCPEVARAQRRARRGRLDGCSARLPCGDLSRRGTRSAGGGLESIFGLPHAVWDTGVALMADSRLEVQQETRLDSEMAELETPVTRFRACTGDHYPFSVASPCGVAIL